MQRIQRADVLVMRLLVDVPAERVEHAVDVVANLEVAVHQLGVVVAEDRAARSHGEEKGAAAHEGLVVAAQPARDVAQQLREQRRLAAGPFEEGRRSGALLGHVGAQGRLGAAELQDGHAGLGSTRDLMRKKSYLSARKVDSGIDGQCQNPSDKTVFPYCRAPSAPSETRILYWLPQSENDQKRTSRPRVRCNRPVTSWKRGGSQYEPPRIRSHPGLHRPVTGVDQIDPAPGQPEVEAAADQVCAGDPLAVGKRPGERETPDRRGKRRLCSARKGEVAQLAGDRDRNSPRAEHAHQPGIEGAGRAVESVLRRSVVVVVDAQRRRVGVEQEVPVEPAGGSRRPRGGGGRIGEQAEGAFGSSEGDAAHADDAIVGDRGATVRVDDVVAVGDRRVGPGEPRSGEDQQEKAANGAEDQRGATAAWRQLCPFARSALSSGCDSLECDGDLPGDAVAQPVFARTLAVSCSDRRWSRLVALAIVRNMGSTRLQTLLETPSVVVSRFDHGAGPVPAGTAEEACDHYCINFVDSGEFGLGVGKRFWRLARGAGLPWRPGTVH